MRWSRLGTRPSCRRTLRALRPMPRRPSPPSWTSGPRRASRGGPRLGGSPPGRPRRAPAGAALPVASLLSAGATALAAAVAAIASRDPSAARVRLFRTCTARCSERVGVATSPAARPLQEPASRSGYCCVRSSRPHLQGGEGGAPQSKKRRLRQRSGRSKDLRGQRRPRPRSVETAPPTPGPLRLRARPPRRRTLGARSSLAPTPPTSARTAPGSSKRSTPTTASSCSSSIRDGGEGEAGARLRPADPRRQARRRPRRLLRHRRGPLPPSSRPMTSPRRLSASANGCRTRASEIEACSSSSPGRTPNAERAAPKPSCATERRHAASLRSQLMTLQRRANLSRVSLRIETGAGSSGSSGDASGWGVGDALDDAGHILAIAAGVVIVGLAVSSRWPSIVLLAWLATSRLDAPPRPPATRCHARRR